ncbi:MAG: hypothetical protein ACYTGB_14225 [Planctomycetota bacterium]|jgi:hypothetical protein
MPLQPGERLVALVDMGVHGRYLSVGSRLVGDVLQWYDGRELHLVRGRLLEERARKRSFAFETAADGAIIKFSRLSPEAFEKRFREGFPDAPHEATEGQLASWLLREHGLWPAAGR